MLAQISLEFEEKHTIGMYAVKCSTWLWEVNTFKRLSRVTQYLIHVMVTLHYPPRLRLLYIRWASMENKEVRSLKQFAGSKMRFTKALDAGKHFKNSFGCNICHSFEWQWNQACSKLIFSHVSSPAFAFSKIGEHKTTTPQRVSAVCVWFRAE